MAQAMNITAWCLGSNEMNSTTAEAFGFENLAGGRVLIDCGATDSVQSMEPIEAIIDKSEEDFRMDPDWVSVDINDRPVYKFGDAKRKEALSKVRVAHLHVYAQVIEGVRVLSSAKSLNALGAVINFETGHAMFPNLEPETVVLLERSPTGHLWMDLFEQMPLVSDNPVSLLGLSQLGTNVGLRSGSSKAQIFVARNASQRTFLSPQTHATDTLDTTTFPRHRAHPQKPESTKSMSDLKKSVTVTSESGFRATRAHVTRRSDGSTGTAGMGTNIQCGAHSFQGEKHLARTRGESNEVAGERLLERMWSESEEQDRAERLVQVIQHSPVGTRDKATADEEKQRSTSRARTTARSNPGLLTSPRKDVLVGVRS